MPHHEPIPARRAAPAPRAPAPGLADSALDAAAPAPCAPMRQPASPGRARASFESILARARRPAPSALPIPSPATLQRKGNGLPPVATLDAWKSVAFLQDDFDVLIAMVRQYADPVATPDNNHGAQLLQLDEIEIAVRAWEAEKQAAEQPGTRIPFSKTEDRRPLVLQVKAALPAERALVGQQGLAVALQNHIADRQALQAVIDAGAAQNGDRMLRNSCEQVLAGNVKLFALTPTGDSDARIEAEAAAARIANAQPGAQPRRVAKRPTDVALFPKPKADAGHHLRNPALPAPLYPANLGDTSGVLIISGVRDGNGALQTRGLNGAGFVGLIEARTMAPAAIEEVLRHEIQHDADEHRGREESAQMAALEEEYAALPPAPAGAATPAADALRAQFETETALIRAKSEMRAYAYQEGAAGGPFSNADNVTQNQRRDAVLLTQRQAAIVDHLLRDYAYFAEQWAANRPVRAGGSFQQAIAAYRDFDSEGMNRWNSPRVSNFIDVLDRVGLVPADWPHALNDASPQESTGRKFGPMRPELRTDDPTEYPMSDLRRAIDALHAEDARYILHEAPALRRKINSHLDGPAKAVVIDLLSKMANP